MTFMGSRFLLYVFAFCCGALVAMVSFLGVYNLVLGESTTT